MVEGLVAWLTELDVKWKLSLILAKIDFSKLYACISIMISLTFPISTVSFTPLFRCLYFLISSSFSCNFFYALSSLLTVRLHIIWSFSKCIAFTFSIDHWTLLKNISILLYERHNILDLCPNLVYSTYLVPLGKVSKIYRSQHCLGGWGVHMILESVVGF